MEKIKICSICGKNFVVFIQYGNGRATCSSECSHILTVQNNTKSKCLPNCQCNRHISKKCFDGCQCGLHTPNKVFCQPGCACGRHNNPKHKKRQRHFCIENCWCKRHEIGPCKANCTCQRHSEKTKNKLRKASIDDWASLNDKERQKRMHHLINKQKSKGTLIEKIMIGIFDKFNIHYEYQKPIGRYVVDFYLPDKNLIIECDGAYWHNRKEALESDKIREQFLIQCEYKVKRMLETRIKKLRYIHGIIV